MSRSKAGTFFSVALALAIAACGDDHDGVTRSVTPPPNVSGNYFGGWTLQVLRKSDGFRKQFHCEGVVALQQSETSTSNAVLSGWATAGPPCSTATYDLRGVVRVNGSFEFASDGPAPPEGPCRGGQGVTFSGLIIVSNLGGGMLSARGVADVTCPEFGEHRLTYIIEAWRR